VVNIKSLPLCYNKKEKEMKTSKITAGTYSITTANGKVFVARKGKNGFWSLFNCKDSDSTHEDNWQDTYNSLKECKLEAERFSKFDHTN